MLWIFKLSILDSFTTQFPKELGKRVGNWVSVLSSSSSLSFLFFSYTASEQLVPRLWSYKLASQKEKKKPKFIGAGCLLAWF
jgi:hypothetical protein